ncbi:hypothetical protein [uncultured Friedmanniella sp.]|uniref:hypothetical protein n=1 Tax=uncultured Friedmanniella sp. TaxID=335381 RepID=UPI0035CA781D
MEIARRRLDRALLHCEQLEGGLREFFRDRPFRVFLEHDRELGRFLIRGRILRQPPEEFSQIAGDAIHNLRASLDNLMWGFARMHQDPPKRPRRVAFPIYDVKTAQSKKQPSWDVEGREAVDGVVAPAVADVIEQFQPCIGSPEDPQGHLLWVLNLLWNENKHRNPSVTAGATVLWETVLQDLVFVNTMITPPLSYDGPFQDGDALAWLDYDPAGSIEGEPDFRFALPVAFSADSAARGANVQALLRQLHTFLLHSVLPAFERL